MEYDHKVFKVVCFYIFPSIRVYKIACFKIRFRQRLNNLNKIRLKGKTISCKHIGKIENLFKFETKLKPDGKIEKYMILVGD